MKVLLYISSGKRFSLQLASPDLSSAIADDGGTSLFACESAP